MIFIIAAFKCLVLFIEWSLFISVIPQNVVSYLFDTLFNPFETEHTRTLVTLVAVLDRRLRVLPVAFGRTASASFSPTQHIVRYIVECALLPVLFDLSTNVVMTATLLLCRPGGCRYSAFCIIPCVFGQRFHCLVQQRIELPTLNDIRRPAEHGHKLTG